MIWLKNITVKRSKTSKVMFMDGCFNMKVFEVIEFSEKNIVGKGVDQIKEIYGEIKAENNFIVNGMWYDDENDSKQLSKLIIANSLLSRVENGEYELLAEEE